MINNNDKNCLQVVYAHLFQIEKSRCISTEIIIIWETGKREWFHTFFPHMTVLVPDKGNINEDGAPYVENRRWRNLYPCANHDDDIPKN